MRYGPIKFTHSLFRGVSLASLAVNLPYVFVWMLYVLKSVTISHFLRYDVSYAVLVQMLANHWLRYIHSWMKEMRMVPMQYVILEY